MGRRGLTSDLVVEAASALADDLGLDRVTVAAVADRLGVRPSSLYNHVESLTGLRRSVSLRADRELRQVLVAATVGTSGAEAIRALSRACRGWAHLHPARYQASQATPQPAGGDDGRTSPAAMAVISDVLAAQHPAGYESADDSLAIRSGLHGFLTLESQHAFGLLGSDNDRSFERMVSGFPTSAPRAVR